MLKDDVSIVKELPSHMKSLNLEAIGSQSNTTLSVQQEKTLKQMGATVRNAGSYIERLKLNQEREIGNKGYGKNVCGTII
ncbi:hypothetical protein HN51_055078 [Arachis hypogaea]